MKTRRFALSVLCLLGITPVSGSAAILTFTFEGHITGKRDPLGLLNFADVGDDVVYTFSFDSEAVPNSYTATSASYRGMSAALLAHQTSFISQRPSIWIQHPLDLFDVSSVFEVTLPGLQPQGYVYSRLSDQSESNALTSVDLPAVPYDLTPFSHRTFSLAFTMPIPGGSSEILSLSGQVDRFTPEPNTLVLMMSAILLSRGPRRLQYLLTTVRRQRGRFRSHPANTRWRVSRVRAGSAEEESDVQLAILGCGVDCSGGDGSAAAGGGLPDHVSFRRDHHFCR